MAACDGQGVPRSDEDSKSVDAIAADARVDEDVREPGAAAQEETPFGREPGERGEVVIDLQVRVVARELAALRDQRPAEPDEEVRTEGDSRVDDVHRHERSLVGRAL